MANYVFNYDQYKKNIYKKNNYAFPIIFLIIILLLGLCVYLKPKYTKYYNYHFVEIDCFQTYKDANILANSIDERGGAGYIYFDGKYHVLASYYVEYDDAENITNNLKNEYSNAKVFTIETKIFVNNSSLNSAQNDAVKNLLETSKEHIIKLEKLSNQFDSKKVSYNELVIHIENIKKEYSETNDNFLSAFNAVSKYNLAKEYTEEILSSLNTILKTSEQNMSSIFRYQIINIVINRYQFLSCF